MGAVSIARSRIHGVVLALVCVAVVAALLAATLGTGVSDVGLRELVSGPGLPSGSGLPAAPATARAAASARADRPPVGRAH
jgi:hypothetical protein